ncbi:RNA polymerase ECF-type sigma factor [Asticcacaulis excentricus]|uniref:RNA polymerase ECF-type sigma factor n=1 Tax=Asticcacaulis excentricus (strain ATCC 15261 / DSM 4724 / KCTC 12464 / NCIMB 9791 / VKM B-1370 / CB 48) TaxID=573065 RepID=E8RPS6_ASTEC|nr:RNA polymerase ECF-type sigma factor [Asticcacaulis excentricus]ADU12053.1 RNA polymerase ECF-type sigma factor [Asticcacaulis excentricus CB 48]
MDPEAKARALLSKALERKWDNTARRVAEGKGGWIMQAVVGVLAEQIKDYDLLKARYDALVANQAASRSRLQKMLLTEAEEVDRLRKLLASSDQTA